MLGGRVGRLVVEEGCLVVEEGRLVVEEGGLTRENEITMKRTAAKKGSGIEKGKGLKLFARHAIAIEINSFQNQVLYKDTLLKLRICFFPFFFSLIIFFSVCLGTI